MYNNNPNEEQIISFLKDAVENVKNASEPDIQLFDAIKKLYAKNVPFSKRKYVAAYLVKQALSGGRGRFSHDRSDRFDKFSRDRNADRSSSRKSGSSERIEHADRAERADRTERPERAPRVQIDEAVASTIFVGIGRNRRVYPRDLVGLLVSVCGLDRERIGDIRVLANYSFIQLFTEDCEKVISSLNGYEYRGRKLSVSYSKQKDGDSAAEAAAVAAESPVADDNADDITIPANVTNESHGLADTSETAKISEAQTAFAQQQTKISSGESGVGQKPYSETTDDGQVKSHFGSGAAY
ncbi:MAG: DbpA RNA binding domain-containing protein [Treponema sp.]|nr:DbpA RNA binding domain-containing protein [Treponema sp.]